MTINHIFVWASAAKAQSLQAFYRTILKPVGYSELIRVNDGNLVGYGSDYPYLWLKTLPAEKSPLATHIAFDAPSEFLSKKFIQRNTNILRKAMKLLMSFIDWHCEY
jgi:hypothetical protein